jgi:hypothetical protein
MTRDGFLLKPTALLALYSNVSGPLWRAAPASQIPWEPDQLIRPGAVWSASGFARSHPNHLAGSMQTQGALPTELCGTWALHAPGKHTRRGRFLASSAVW